VLDGRKKSFLSFDCSLCVRGEGELRLYVAMAIAGGLFRGIKREVVRKVTETWKKGFFLCGMGILLREGF
jgi:hypothetical protein